MGDDADSMFFISQGHVRVSFASRNGDAVDLADLNAGGYFGELGLMGAKVRSSTVTALSFCELERLMYTDMEELMGQEPELSRHMISVSKVRIQRLREKFKESVNDKEQTRSASIMGPQNVRGSARVRPSGTRDGVGIWRGVAEAVLDKSLLFSGVQAAMHAEAKAIKIPNAESQSVI